jgi:hypothetical protein
MFAVQLALGFAMGVDVYADGNIDKLLTDINDNQEAFVLWAALGMMTSLLFAPAALGFYQVARESDRTYLAIPAGLFGLAAVISALGYGIGIILPEVAENYIRAAGATREALLHDGETLQSMVLLFSGAAMTAFALGMVTTGVLSLRSGFFPRWFAWATIAVGIIGAVPFFGFVGIVPGRILWLLICGAIMFRRAGSVGESSQASTSPAPVPA